MKNFSAGASSNFLQQLKSFPEQLMLDPVHIFTAASHRLEDISSESESENEPKLK